MVFRLSRGRIFLSGRIVSRRRRSSESKVVLYGAQGGNCNGCGTHFLPQHLTVDHIIARSKGGTDHLDNLQLLCGHCNSLKGDRPKEYLRARLVRAV